MGVRDMFQKYENLRGKDPIDVISEHLHSDPVGKEGTTYRFPCPYCPSKNNMSYDTAKDILHCFGAGGIDHNSQLLKEIFSQNATKEEKRRYAMEKNNGNNSKPTFYKKKEIYKPADSPYVKERADISKAEQNQDMLQKYCNSWAGALIAPDWAEHLDFIREKRGFTKETIKALKIGFCENERIFSFKTGETKNYTGFTFPKFIYSTNPEETKILTYEFRAPDLKSKWVWDGLPHTSLCQINKYNPNITTTLLVTEGFMDGYAWYQHLNSLGVVEQYHIVTPSNGIGALEAQLKQVDWEKYKIFILSVDNDDAGNKTFYKIMQTYTKPSGAPLFIDGRVNCAKCARPCGLCSADFRELVERDSDPENCPELYTYSENIKAGLKATNPCKDCEISNCNYKIWIDSRCKDFNDYLRKALL